jgi:hypothetical protein
MNNCRHDLLKDFLHDTGSAFSCGCVGLALLPRQVFVNPLRVRFISVRAIYRVWVEQ